MDRRRRPRVAHRGDQEHHRRGTSCSGQPRLGCGRDTTSARVQTLANVTYAYLAAASVFASVTFSDDWHAVINDGVGTTALSVVSGILIGTILIATRRLGR